jgi:hypothetical protein
VDTPHRSRKRPLPSSVPTAEDQERIVAVPAQLDETRQRAREVTEDLRERFDELEPLVRERWAELEPVLRERWNEIEPVVRERWDELEPVVRERLEDLQPAARQAQIGLWRALRALFAGLAVLPSILVKVARAVAGSADEVAERGAQVGEEALKRRRAGRGIRMRKRTLVAYVAGGAGVGFVIGWVLGRRAAEEEASWYDEATMDGGRPIDTGLPSAGASPVG